MIEIYCLHYLLPGNSLLNDPLFSDYFAGIKESSYILPSNHMCLHISDSIHYKVLMGEVSFELYNRYVGLTGQREHNENTFKHLINNFDFELLEPIETYNLKIGTLYKKVISDGCHRLSILMNKKCKNIDRYIT
jgi:hypothetical protein